MGSSVLRNFFYSASIMMMYCGIASDSLQQVFTISGNSTSSTPWRLVESSSKCLSISSVIKFAKKVSAFSRVACYVLSTTSVINARQALYPDSQSPRSDCLPLCAISILLNTVCVAWSGMVLSYIVTTGRTTNDPLLNTFTCLGVARTIPDRLWMPPFPSSYSLTFKRIRVITFFNQARYSSVGFSESGTKCSTDFWIAVTSATGVQSNISEVDLFCLLLSKQLCRRAPQLQVVTQLDAQIIVVPTRLNMRQSLLYTKVHMEAVPRVTTLWNIALHTMWQNLYEIQFPNTTSQVCYNLVTKKTWMHRPTYHHFGTLHEDNTN